MPTRLGAAGHVTKAVLRVASDVTNDLSGSKLTSPRTELISRRYLGRPGVIIHGSTQEVDSPAKSHSAMRLTHRIATFRNGSLNSLSST